MRNDLPTWLITSPNDRKALEQGYYYDPAPAERVIWFVENFIVHHKSEFAGAPFLLEPWQRELIHRLYGWRRPDGRRRFTHVWFEIGRGNGKTKLLSALALYHLIADGVKGAEVYCAASDRGQASILFNEAKDSIRASSELDQLCKCLRSEIRFDHTGSVFRTVSADGYRSHGYNPSTVFVDEVHTFHSNEVVEALETGLNKRGEQSQPLLFFATTAGFPNTYYEEMHLRAVGVANGTIEDLHFLPVIYAVPAGADWRDESNWHLANPNMGVSVSLERMREYFTHAQTSMTQQISFRRLYLNQIVQAENKWLSLADWDQCRAPYDLSDCITYAGLDLSETQDITALVLAHYSPKTEQIYVEPHFFYPAEQLLDTGKRNHNLLLAWAADRLLTTTEGKTIKHRAVLGEILRLHTQYNIREIALDPFQGILLAEDLAENGIQSLRFHQSKSWYTTPCKELEKHIADRRLVHDGNAILRWMVDNVVLEQDLNGGYMPSKQKSREKIDGVTALVMALDRVIRNAGGKDTQPQKSAYEGRGIIFI